MKLTITIDCDNAAFEEDAGAEVCHILGNLATECLGHSRQWILAPQGLSRFPLRDSNGNTVGKVTVSE